MKIKHYIASLLLLSIASFAQNKNSFVLIKGTTNVNTFKCTNDNFHQQAPLSLEALQKNKFTETNISFAVKDFDCKNKVMTNDFQNTLNAEKYPFLAVTFISMDKVSESKFKACVQVKMMNKLKKYFVDFALMDSKLIGSKTIFFSDFDIVPPKKFGGLVYVKDALDLSFSLNMN